MYKCTIAHPNSPMRSDDGHTVDGYGRVHLGFPCCTRKNARKQLPIPSACVSLAVATAQ